MNLRKKAVLLAALVPTLALANNARISDTKIDNVRVRHGVAYVKFSHCTSYSRIYLNSDYAKAMFSTALTAGSTQKSVAVEFAGNTCSGTEAELIYLDLNFKIN